MKGQMKFWPRTLVFVTAVFALAAFHERPANKWGFVAETRFTAHGDRIADGKCRMRLWGEDARPTVSNVTIAEGRLQPVRRAALIDSDTCEYVVETGYILGSIPQPDWSAGTFGQKVPGSSRTRRALYGG